MADPATYADPVVENDMIREGSPDPARTSAPAEECDNRPGPETEAGEAAGDTRSESVPAMTDEADEAARDKERLERLIKVQKLKAAIADGTYETDPETVARKILERGL